jgi:putative hemolysin
MPKPHVKIDFKSVRYQVKTATTWSEVLSVLRLRHEIFFREFMGKSGRKKWLPIDLDRHDFSFDHLIVKDLRDGRVVACYRLQSSKFKKSTRKFYTEEEFNLDDFLSLTGHKVELGRASVHKDYRKGTVIILLWQGLYQYVKKVEAKYLFGCSSLSSTHFERIPQIINDISSDPSNQLGFQVKVKSKYAINSLNSVMGKAENLAAEGNLNSLMGMYKLAGAKFSTELAYDKELDCVDIFTCLDFDHLPEIFEQKLKRAT